ncbi:uncharacterized protein NDAI_0F03490 [Naumovozyma dairenensis CBS 421]|uniref:Uncharacterized protein n=1 Tax=Naumovozyma dairenensis (strain ATCC 10597 / BCRC 20456 / CBS 421 / NBRC 0211 / NRRL Y-12639) TaxID=1071378 RepID=G0WD06_NAUDC|nr:hypothetical protein NDAI_0F03490 [Naumovozyma dairenensis CBS 421]CCD25667.1 hypothetical protein NDAI_0F03490 [Naumovozyma dairenensis CBS 421]
MNRTRFISKKKQNHVKHAKKQPITQDDYYIEATELEEQAERWQLSDLKKTLRFYIKAMEFYDYALSQAPDKTTMGSFEVYYNKTRLLLKIFTDFTNNNGYINVFDFIKSTDDLSNLECLISPIEEIVSNFEEGLTRFNDVNVITWDYKFNLLTAYVTLLESSDLTGALLIELLPRFITLTQELIRSQLNELEENRQLFEADNSDADSTGFQQLSPTDKPPSRDGSGVRTNLLENDTEIMEVSDQITTTTIQEVFVNAYKFAETVLETILQNASNTINEIQKNYILDTVLKFCSQLDDMITTTNLFTYFTNDNSLELSELEATKLGIKGITYILQNDLSLLEELLSSTTQVARDQGSLLSVKIDVLQLAISTINEQELSIKWKLSTALSKLLNENKGILSEKRSKLTASMAHGDELSQTVFQLCLILNTSADNEMSRWSIKKNIMLQENQHNENGNRTLEILKKNARTLLTNSTNMSQIQCGLQETIIDKIKRNYIYQQSTLRINDLESGDGTEYINNWLQ